MCEVCGCGQGRPRVDGEPRHHPPSPDGAAQRHGHAHVHAHRHTHGDDGSLHFGANAAGVSVAGHSAARLVRIEQDILARNDAIAAHNRARFGAAGVLALNLVSSPGAGKTALLLATLERLADHPVAVIEGDQETSADAQRIRATGVAAVQVNTGKGCHLDAAMIASAMDHLDVPGLRIVFIENVGNLVCPAGFDLGEAMKVVICSVTEGEDKPLKYPGMFAAAGLLLVSKIDLLPYLEFDVEALVAHARRINPGIAVMRVSARTGEGMERWLAWLEDRARGSA